MDLQSVTGDLKNILGLTDSAQLYLSACGVNLRFGGQFIFLSLLLSPNSLASTHSGRSARPSRHLKIRNALQVSSRFASCMKNKSRLVACRP